MGYGLYSSTFSFIPRVPPGQPPLAPRNRPTVTTRTMLAFEYDAVLDEVREGGADPVHRAPACCFRPRQIKLQSPPEDQRERGEGRSRVVGRRRERYTEHRPHRHPESPLQQRAPREDLRRAAPGARQGRPMLPAPSVLVWHEGRPFPLAMARQSAATAGRREGNGAIGSSERMGNID